MVKKVKDLFPEMSEFSKATSKLNELTEFVNITKAINESSQSPTIGNDVTMNWGTYGVYQGPARIQTLREFIRLSVRVSEIRAPIQHVTSEVFRRGITWKPRFVVKCSNCNTEYDETKELCEKCGSESLVKPDEKQKERFNLYLSDANIFDNSFEEILKAFNINLAALDDGILYNIKEYIGDDITGGIRSKVIEIRNISPADIDFDLDAQGLPKNNHFICYLHRDGEISSLPGNCSLCGRNLVPVMYILHHRGKDIYLTDSEIIHASRQIPSETWGVSPIFTIMDKAMTLIGMDSNMYNYFWNRKMPASMIMVFTDDPESVRKAQKEMENKTRQDNNYIPMVAVSSRNQRGRVDMVRLFHTLQEMEYLPVRQEIRERIAEIWGVTPIWQASSDSSGGIGSQSQQLVVMSRVVEGYQRIYHEKVFPKILYAFGITDWTLYLPQPEEKSEQTRIAFAQQRTAIASQLHNMGFNVEIRSSGSSVDDIDFVVSGKALNPQQAMFGGSSPTDDGGGGEGVDSTPPIALSSDVDTQQRGWLNQIISSGYTAPIIKHVNNEGTRVYFVMNGKDYLSSFDTIGKLIKIEEIVIQRPVQTQPIKSKFIPKKPLDNDYFEEE